MLTRLCLPSLAGLALLLAGCAGDGHFTLLGYTSKPNYDTDIKTVRVPIFENRTFRRGLEFDLTRELVRQIEQFTPYKVVPCTQDADTELTGIITFANKSIINRNQLNEVREAETGLIVEIVWRDLHSGEILSRPRKGNDDPLRRVPAAPVVQVGPDGRPLEPPPLPPEPGDRFKEVVLAQSLAYFIPELGESITTAYQKNVKRLATQIVSMMETPW